MILGPANDETGEGAVVDQHIISENEESTPIPIGSTILSVHQPSSSNSPTLLKSLAFDKILNHFRDAQYPLTITIGPPTKMPPQSPTNTPAPTPTPDPTLTNAKSFNKLGTSVAGWGWVSEQVKEMSIRRESNSEIDVEKVGEVVKEKEKEREKDKDKDKEKAGELEMEIEEEEKKAHSPPPPLPPPQNNFAEDLLLANQQNAVLTESVERSELVISGLKRGLRSVENDKSILSAKISALENKCEKLENQQLRIDELEKAAKLSAKKEVKLARVEKEVGVLEDSLRKERAQNEDLELKLLQLEQTTILDKKKLSSNEQKIKMQVEEIANGSLILSERNSLKQRAIALSKDLAMVSEHTRDEVREMATYIR